MNAADRDALHELALRFADGDRSAFDRLFDSLHPILLSFAQRTLSPSDAEDAAQEAIVKIFARIADLDRARNVVPWALSITAFEVLTIRKRHARRRETASEVELETERGPSPEEHAATREALADLEAYLGALGDDERRTIEAELHGEVARGERDRKRRWRALDRLRRFWRTSHG